MGSYGQSSSVVNLGVICIGYSVDLISEKNKERIDTKALLDEALTAHVGQHLEYLAAQNIKPQGLYELTINVIDAALLREVMRQVKGNQSNAARILGLNRGTLRTKLKRHKIGAGYGAF